LGSIVTSAIGAHPAEFEVVHIISPLWTRKPPVPEFSKTLKKEPAVFIK
jgi:hypothetical protein